MPASSPSQEPTLEFSVSGAPESGGPERLEVTRTAPGVIALAGVISTPTPCYDIGAKLAREDATLTLTLTATARPGFCVQMIGAFAYSATIGRLQAGAYDLVVVHEYPGTGWERRVYRQRADVPPAG
jgi:hypothetical protein